MQQTAPKDTSPEEVKAALEEENFKEMAPEEVAFEEVASGKIAHQEAEAEGEETFEKIAPEEAEAALEKVDREEVSPKGADVDVRIDLADAAATQQHSAQDAKLSAKEPQASPEESGIALEDSSKDTADTAANTIDLTKETKPKSTKKPQTKKLPLVENRRLQDQNLFRSIGKEYPFSL